MPIACSTNRLPLHPIPFASCSAIPHLLYKILSMEQSPHKMLRGVNERKGECMMAAGVHQGGGGVVAELPELL